MHDNCVLPPAGSSIEGEQPVLLKEWPGLYQEVLGEHKAFLLSRPDQFKVVDDEGLSDDIYSVELADGVHKIRNHP